MTKLLRLPAVIELTGKSRSSIYADPSFPKPIKIGQRSVAWVQDELNDWATERLAERPVTPQSIE